MGETYRTFKEELTPILNLFQEIQEVGRFPIVSFYKDTIILIPKPGKDIKRKKTTGQYL